MAETWEHDLFPGRTGAWLAPASGPVARGERSATLQAEIARFREINPSRSPQDFFLGEVLPVVYAHRASVRRAFSGDAAYLEQILQMGLQHLSWALSQSDQMEGVTATFKGYLYQLMADLSSRAGKESAIEHYLDQALSYYEEDDCLPGIGACLLLAGDRLAAPYSTPSTFNLELTDHYTKSGKPPDSSSENGWRNPKIQSSEALSYYLEAKEFYRDADSLIGLGQVAHRIGYLHAIDDDFDTALRYSKEAEESFMKAGDSRSAHLAKVHSHLISIGRGMDQINVQLAIKIGEWGLSTGNTSFTIGLGLLYCAMGRTWMKRERQTSKSKACFRLAKALFEIMGQSQRAAYCHQILKQSAV